MCSVFHYFVYVSHLIKFVCSFVFFFRCHRIFLANKDIQWSELAMGGRFAPSSELAMGADSLLRANWPGSEKDTCRGQFGTFDPCEN